MKIHRMMFGLAATFAVATSAVFAQQPAQQPGTRPAPAAQNPNVQDQNRIQQQGTRPITDPTAAARLDEKTQGTAVRASKLIGMNVKNHQNENIGEVKDIVIDAKSGKVRYAALSFGGFLGIGDKLFAIPWDMLQVQRDGNDYHLVLQIDEPTLKNAPGFDKDNWPDFSNQQLTGEVDRFYQNARTPRGGAGTTVPAR